MAVETKVMSPDGGSHAARGLRYQYLHTVHELLDLVTGQHHDAASLQVEGLGPAATGTDQQIVDYSVLDGSGGTVRLVQVKSVADRSMTTGIGEVVAVVARLVEHEALSSALITNASGSRHARDLATALSGSSSDDDLRARLLVMAQSQPAVSTLLALDGPRFSRLLDCRVAFDEDDPDVLAEKLGRRLLQHRLAQRSGIGSPGIGMLLNHLLQTVMDRAATSPRREITLAEARELVNTDPLVVARAAGRLTWGRLHGMSAPPVPPVPREDLMPDLERFLAGRTARGVVSVALTGLSGIGKSSLVRAYVAENADAFDFVVWLDCSSAEALRLSVTTFLSDTGSSPQQLDDRSLRRAFQSVVADHPGRWLVVFDNATDQREILPWIPPRGDGRVIVTSTNAAAWTTTSHRMAVPPMTAAQGRALVQQRLAGEPGGAEDVEALDVLVERLGRWPLALEVAAAYLQTSGAGRDQVDRYTEVVRDHALDDEEFVPPGYPSTLGGALAFACARVAARDERAGTSGLALLRVLSLTGSRAVPTTLAWSAAARRDLVAGAPWERPVDHDPNRAHLVDATVRALMAQSLVRRHRVPGLDAEGRWAEEACDVLSTNEVVQHVVRRLAGADGPDVAEALGATLLVFGTAVEHGVNAGRISSAALAEPHVMRALAHAERWEEVALFSVTALGNLSVLALATGRPSAAIGLTWRQEQMVERGLAAGLVQRTTPTRAIAAQTRATAELKRNSTPEQVFLAASSALQILDDLVEEQPDHPFVAHVIASLQDVLRVLAEVKDHEPSRRALAGLVERHGHVVSGSTDENLRTSLAMGQAMRSIDDDPAGAAARLRAIIDQPSTSEHQRVTATAGLADALAVSGHLEDAVTALEGADPSGRLGADVVLHAGNVGSTIARALLVATYDGSVDVDDARRRSLSGLLERTCHLLDGGGQRLDTDLYDTLRLLTFRAVARWGAGDRAGARSGLGAARDLQVEHAAALRDHPSVRTTDMSWIHNSLERALLLGGSTRLTCTDARYVEYFDGRQLQARMILRVSEVPPDLTMPSGTSRPAVPGRWLPPLGDQITLHVPGPSREPAGDAGHHLDLQPAAPMRQRLRQMARRRSEGSIVTVALCESDPADITVEDVVENTVPRLVLLRVDGWEVLLDEG